MGGFGKAVALSLGLRRDGDRSTGPGSSGPRSDGSGSARRPPACATRSANGVTERFIRTLKEERIYLHDVETLAEAREVIGAFIGRYNHGWLLPRHGYVTPARTREKFSRRAA
ncbi:MAG: transposase [Proteobacteria bacterium]|nr:transposase [Pseudomonadota bacterium]